MIQLPAYAKVSKDATQEQVFILLPTYWANKYLYCISTFEESLINTYFLIANVILSTWKNIGCN